VQVFKSPVVKIITIALTTAILGGLVNYLSSIETSLGLDTLFRLRGPRSAPSEVVVVAMDEASETRLNVGQDLPQWRGFHAQLIAQLQRQGAALVVFDLQFIAPHVNQDPALSASMLKAGNVLITDCVQALRRGVDDFYGRDECSLQNQQPFVQKDGGLHPLAEQLIAMRKITATPLLANSTLDHAPFYLTNDAQNTVVREGWIFLDALAEMPTMPLVAWISFMQLHANPQSNQSPIPKQVSGWLTEQRRNCLNNPSQYPLPDNQINQLICGADTRYLDFYGPPQTLRMESYSDVFDGKVSDLTGKIVFVGKANRLYSPGKTDYFQTPFTDSKSGKMAGVEIMATQFANLLENRFVSSPVTPNLVVLLYGLVIAWVLTQLTGLTGMLVSLLVSGVYAMAALWLFHRQGFWLPVAVPFLIQLPIAWLMVLWWSRSDLLQERKRILTFVRRVFPQWVPFLPSSPGQWYPEINTEQFSGEQDVFGICLATDIEGYTSLAAQHTPHQMWELLNDYYQALGHPVSSYDGIIADVAGDAMMSIWVDSLTDNYQLSACLAALEMEQAVERFNENSSIGQLPTRIGLHAGDMTLGRLDAGEGSHYRAIGDTVNTASRIQGVNKVLGTKILASSSIVTDLPKIVYRPVGFFRVIGREDPLELMEIVGLESDVSKVQLKLYQHFNTGLSKFKAGEWQAAILSLKGLLDQYGYDGPTQFYLNLALMYRDNPPPDWAGVVTLGSK